MLKQFAKYGSSEGAKKKKKREKRWEHCLSFALARGHSLYHNYVYVTIKIKTGKHYNRHCSLGNTDKVGLFKRLMLCTPIPQYIEKNTTELPSITSTSDLVETLATGDTQ